MRSNLLVFSIWLMASLVWSSTPCSSENLPTNNATPDTINWHIHAGANLRIVLSNWTKIAGWNLIWQTPKDYNIQIPVTLIGSFEQVIHQLMDSVNRTNPEIEALLYQRNKVVVILSRNLLG